MPGSYAVNNCAYKEGEPRAPLSAALNANSRTKKKSEGREPAGPSDSVLF
jgi:hypothetical protein